MQVMCFMMRLLMHYIQMSYSEYTGTLSKGQHEYGKQNLEYDQILQK